MFAEQSIAEVSQLFVAGTGTEVVRTKQLLMSKWLVVNKAADRKEKEREREGSRDAEQLSRESSSSLLKTIILQVLLGSVFN